MCARGRTLASTVVPSGGTDDCPLLGIGEISLTRRSDPHCAVSVDDVSPLLGVGGENSLALALLCLVDRGFTGGLMTSVR